MWWPKHDLNLSVRWYRNDEELVSGGRMRISHEYGHAALPHLTPTRRTRQLRVQNTNELGEDSMTEANLIRSPLPHTSSSSYQPLMTQMSLCRYL